MIKKSPLNRAIITPNKNHERQAEIKKGQTNWFAH
jgi:hypothetical protein